MSLDLTAHQPLQFTMVYQHSKLAQVMTNSPLIDHFLRKVKLTQSENTWINYAHDFKIFFATVKLPPDRITRRACLAFIEQHNRARLSRLTIHRRLPSTSPPLPSLHTP